MINIQSSYNNKTICLCLILLACNIANAQQYYTWNNNRLILDNGFVHREVTIDSNKIFTNNLKLGDWDFNLIQPQGREFSFTIDDSVYDNQSGWAFVAIEKAEDSYHGKGAVIHLKGMNKLEDINISITYLLYPRLPVIRKQISFINNSSKEIKLESVMTESLLLNFSFVETAVFTNYARQKHLGTYIGNWDDALIGLHSYSLNAGLLVGNEAPGVLKRSDYNIRDNEVNAGLTQKEDSYPFRKYLKPSAKWAVPKVFIIPYHQQQDPSVAINTTLADFERKHLGLKVYEHKNFPVIAYNTWTPFRSGVNEKLIDELSKAVADCGFTHFIIDDGWEESYQYNGKTYSKFGDWHSDKNKFPNGLSPVFKKLKNSGLEPGLWMSLGIVSNTSDAFKNHKAWAILNKEEYYANVHSGRRDWDIGWRSMCLATSGWKNYIKGKILEQVGNGVKYFKLDLAIITSAYQNNVRESGCYATEHDGHKDREESFIATYENLFSLFDELHALVPDIVIDCTFEVAGKLQLIDYAFCQHAEVNWLTNVEEPFPTGAYRIRNLAWWKTPVMPASSLLIGNMQIDSPDFVEELKSLIGSFPIVLGDPRKLSAHQRGVIKKWSDWLKLMNEKYNFQNYRQDISGFSEPLEGQWDAWSRMNTDTKNGGIIGVFRQNSPDAERIVVIKNLEPKYNYLVKEAPSGNIILKTTGQQLGQAGIRVKMSKAYEGRLYEIEKIGL